MKKLSIIFIKIALIILFLLCLIDMPYGYYQLVRFLGMFGFAVLAYSNYKINDNWFLVWLASAILINPFFKVTLGRDVWVIIDVVWAILLFISFSFIDLSKKAANR